MSMYIRVKRTNQTIFLYEEPTDTVHAVKNKLAVITKVPHDHLRLLFNNNPLEDSRTLGDLKVENDAILHLVYKKEGTHEFEEVNLQKPSATENDAKAS